MQGSLFGYEDRFPVPINEIALPSDICIFGNHFGENTYYADFAGIARKYAPQAIMEIGVRFGYSGIAMCLGALAAREGDLSRLPLFYNGCDGEFFGANFNHPTEGEGFYRSNSIAAENFRRFIPQVDAAFFTVDTQKQPLPIEIAGGSDYMVTYTPTMFDLINVDGDHSWVGAYSDCKKVWPLLNVGGILLVDDMSMAEVGPAVHHFIKEIEDQNGADAITWQTHHNERDMMFIRRHK